MEDKKAIIVYSENEIYEKEARALADHLQVEYTNDEELARTNGLMLKFSDLGLSLSDGKNEMRGDFAKMIPRLKQNNLSHEMLVKAAKVKGDRTDIKAFDATAGMGEDSLLLAAAGFKVTLYEYDPVIAALLRDTLRRSAEIPELSEIVSRMTLIEGDSLRAMKEVGKEADEANRLDMILLDPMFPERQKSALVKKKFQLLQQLERPCSDEEDMLEAALTAHPKKIIIKRPAKGPFLAGRKPDYSLSGKAIRYDIIVLA